VLYLLDASVLITANNSYYPVDRVPEYWDWLKHMGENGNIKIPLEIFEEIKDGPNNGDKDLLFSWLQVDSNRDALLLDESVLPAHVQRVVNEGYAPDLTDDEVEQLGRDPFLVAYALAHSTTRSIVTVEVSKPKRQRQNRHVPDVCTTLGVKCSDTFQMNRTLDFRTNWKP
jgi:Domain of unknown function (DUF4411)